MKLTTKGRYAVTAMMDLALQSEQFTNQDDVNITLTDIAQRQGISLSYLEQLFASLRKAKLVQAVRGPGGGYSLSRSSQEISVAEILVAVDENLDLTCGHGSACGGEANPCLTHDLWSNLSTELLNFLNDQKLYDIIKLSPYKARSTQNFSGIPIKLN
jgi:Rrf2 family iron-sulfur cluster assembly transcriptional regulator